MYIGLIANQRSLLKQNFKKWHGNGDEKDVSTKNSNLINFDKSLTPMISSSGIPDTPYSQIGDH